MLSLPLCSTRVTQHKVKHINDSILFCLFYLKIGFKINFHFHQISDAQDISVVRGRGNSRRGRGDRSVRRTRGSTVSRSRGGDSERGDRGRGRGGRRSRRVVFRPALPTRAYLAAAAREERDTQLRVYIIFSHRWKCNGIVCL